MTQEFDARFPSVDDLRERARQRIPRFAFEYLDGGCNEDVNLHRNTADIREIERVPQYLAERRGSDMRTELFGHTYDAPFGIAPVGLQGLMWPRSPEILARAAFEHNVPFILMYCVDKQHRNHRQDHRGTSVVSTLSSGRRPSSR